VSWTLDRGLEELSCGGLLILGESAADPDLARFVGSAHLSECFLLYRAGESSGKRGNSAAWLGFLSRMEREEAARTGLRLLDPVQLEVDEARRRNGSSAKFWRDILGRGLALAGLEPVRLAVAGRFGVGASHRALSELARAGWRFEDGKELLLRHRKRKTFAEVEAARRAADGACAAIRRCARVLAEATIDSGGFLILEGAPLTVGCLRKEIGTVLAASGLDQPLGNIVAAGRESAVPHSRGDDEKALGAGETIVIDLFPRGTVFADCTRTFCIGSPSDPIATAHALVLEVLRRSRDQVRQGGSGWDLQRSACERFEARGLPTPSSSPGTERGYVHGLGHGVGYEIHEYPSFGAESGTAGELQRGDLFTLEPGLYEPGEGYGVRLEDLCLISGSGLENLTPLPYDLDPRAW
jgi:Xaa-Pro aminopeptidase